MSLSDNHCNFSATYSTSVRGLEKILVQTLTGAFATAADSKTRSRRSEPQAPLLDAPLGSTPSISSALSRRPWQPVWIPQWHPPEDATALFPHACFYASPPSCRFRRGVPGLPGSVAQISANDTASPVPNLDFGCPKQPWPCATTPCSFSAQVPTLHRSVSHRPRTSEGSATPAPR